MPWGARLPRVAPGGPGRVPVGGIDMDGDAVARDAARALPATLADDPLALQRAIVRLQGLQR